MWEHLLLPICGLKARKIVTWGNLSLVRINPTQIKCYLLHCTKMGEHLLSPLFGWKRENSPLEICSSEMAITQFCQKGGVIWAGQEGGGTALACQCIAHIQGNLAQLSGFLQLPEKVQPLNLGSLECKRLGLPNLIAQHCIWKQMINNQTFWRICESSHCCICKGRGHFRIVHSHCKEEPAVEYCGRRGL